MDIYVINIHYILHNKNHVQTRTNIQKRLFIA